MPDYDEKAVIATSQFVTPADHAQRVIDYYLAERPCHAMHPHLAVSKATIVGAAPVDNYGPGFVRIELTYEPKEK
jgi:hypothetical protein